MITSQEEGRNVWDTEVLQSNVMSTFSGKSNSAYLEVRKVDARRRDALRTARIFFDSAISAHMRVRCRGWEMNPVLGACPVHSIEDELRRL